MSTIRSVINPGRHSHIWGRCNGTRCDGLTLFGVCIKCGWSASCSVCKKVRQPLGNYLAIPHDNNRSSHGFCPACAIAEYESMGLSPRRAFERTGTRFVEVSKSLYNRIPLPQDRGSRNEPTDDIGAITFTSGGVLSVAG